MTQTKTRSVQKRRLRDAEATRNRVLQAAIDEFCEYGFDGARTERIARRAATNIRMLYHYFGSKEKIYRACLEKVYEDLRTKEEGIQLAGLTPDQAIEALVDFTFDHLREHPEFIRLVGIENINQGACIQNILSIKSRGRLLLDKLHEILIEGERQGIFRQDVDPFHFYMTLFSMIHLHHSNQYTLSITFSRNLNDPSWVAERRQHVKDVLLAYLHHPHSNA
ncbi:TetR family transcriptional regulator [Halomonas heilongjiangensis]|uniref:TetR family transcriptional regulator n=1 Tax=Halomonas heilongjiangensis TaxID=1387883 RepID=A0A2N7TGP9_9GAMM|nr:TetR family transcriptional regulator [Halomonas heilongjiangensis]PMR67361.1 TetR family transcriptional regulator [Halomonas heilongjiangensis]PXX88137.1 TetR family transcriptional regulator [Halomonas heilongjiangensis]